MRSKNKSFLKIILVLAVAALFCWSFIWLIDRGLNGLIKDWVYNLFIIEPTNIKEGKLGVLFRSWSEIKLFLRIAFAVFVALLVIGMSVAVYFYSQYRTKRDVALFMNAMNSFLSETEDMLLPEHYAEIEAMLKKIRLMNQKQQQLMQMEMQRKSDLITYLAHDLKTPLASVIGYLSLLEEAPDMPSEQKAKYTGVALDKAFRLEELINEFFDITRFNLQTIVLNKGKIRLAFLLQQLVDEFYPMLNPQGKQVMLQVPEDLILVGDADKLARVFNNILRNAIAYSYENSGIDIKAHQEEKHVILTFINQGDPIPAQRLETIFEKFYRLDVARSTNTGGAGLGLAIAKEIIEAHEGTILVESNPKETIFTIKLPS